MTKVDRMYQIGPKQSEWTIQNHSGSNRTKLDRLDRSGPKLTEQNQSELNRTEVDQIGPNGLKYKTKYQRNTFVVVKFGLKIK